MTRTTFRTLASMVAGGVLAFGAPAMAEEEEPVSAYYKLPVIAQLSNEGKGYDLSDAILGEGSPYNFGGWVQFGYTTDTDGAFNTHPHEYNLHQGWLFAEKATDGSEGFDFGGRVDFMYGVDGANTQSFGNNPGKFDFSEKFNHGDRGFAIPQLYGEVAYKNLKVKAGHFYTLLGYESVMAPNNFFFSHAFTMNFSEPFTHTGVLGTYTATDQITLYGGWTAGWDTGFDRFDQGNNFIGGATYKPIDQVAATYALTAGNLGWLGEGYTHSIVIDTTPFEKFKYVLQSDLVSTENEGSRFDSIGIVNYLTYSICDEFGVGTRLEWWKAQGVSYYGITAGVNVKPVPNLTIRPEGRFQLSPTGDTGHNPIGLPADEHGIFGIDMIWSF